MNLAKSVRVNNKSPFSECVEGPQIGEAYERSCLQEYQAQQGSR